MPDVYATRADFFEHGLPDGVLPNPGRLLAVVYPADDTLELDGHNLAAGAEISFRAEASGSLPAPLSAGAVYYAIPISDALFKVSTTLLGAIGLVPDPVNLTTAGARVVVTRSMNAKIDAALEAASRHFDRYAPAHAVPLEAPYPLAVTVLVCHYAAELVLQMAGKMSDAIAQRADRARAELARFAKGVSVRDARAPSNANLAVVGSRSTSGEVRTTWVGPSWPDPDHGGYLP